MTFLHRWHETTDISASTYACLNDGRFWDRGQSRIHPLWISNPAHVGAADREHRPTRCHHLGLSPLDRPGDPISLVIARQNIALPSHGRTIEVARVRITEAGLRALAG
jgi:hypothetical protein